MEQDVIRSARRRRIHYLKSDSTLCHDCHKVEPRPSQCIPGAQDDDIGIRRQGGLQVFGGEYLGVRSLPIRYDSIRGDDQVRADPLVSDTHAALLPCSDKMTVGSFPVELDRPLQWRVPRDYTSPQCRGRARAMSARARPKTVLPS